ncbi:WD40/YVTN/BNR-like repeat-containing protein [Parapedobacter sp. DT-150]|uniref:WD40/YVTN/BNR-like repeat-containing protein n=1 Tax=Parapedobacter sp. DT-150 TaxID=3396162 RepID=UPI003F53F7C5
MVLRSLLIIGFAGTVLWCAAQDVSLKVLQEGRSISIRGLSVLDDSVAWVSGSDGWVGRTADCGKSWHWQQVAGHDTLDFRDIEAFSATEALIINAGSPLVILRTADGGDNWQEVYRDERPEIFFDGMDFWEDGRGLAYGDPIAGVMQLLATDDGGRTWRDISSNAGIRLATGEAGFAASGTGIRALSGGHAFIATGGQRSRLFRSADYGNTWKGLECPIAQGAASTGIFSVAFLDERHGVVVGGDYQQDRDNENAVLVTDNGGATWRQPAIGTNGYRSAVEYIGKQRLMAVGTSGVDLSSDGGRTWKPVSGESYHTVRKAKNGTWVLLAGGGGRIATVIE